MRQWIHVAVAAAAVGCVSTLMLVFLFRWCRKRNGTNFVEPASLTRVESVQGGISVSRIHQQPFQLDQGSKNSNKGNYNYYVFRGGGVSGKRSFFNWGDHPSMAADAVENGWSRFAFTGYKSYTPSPSKRSALLGVCAAPGGSDFGRESEAEISWEVARGSAEFMQKVRLNPGIKKSHQSNNNNNNGSLGVASIIRGALPLPGPPLGNCAFPQEAYFEITILYSRGDECESVGKSGEGEKTKLLVQGNSNGKGNSEALVHVTSGNGSNKINNVEGESGKGESVMFSLGLTAAGASVPLRVPGSYPGSIGFNSNGSLYLDGMKLVRESEKAEWVGTDKVIGCGFDPRQKKVFFTIDSDLMHVIHCQTEEFGTPLFPIMAANIDIIVLVNFGQSAFKYAPANAQRTPNPCFIAPLVNSPAATLGYDDSKELFSMGRIDSQWLNRSTTKGSHHNNNNNHNNNRTLDFDEESEADLFEIVIDGSGKYQNTAS